MTYERISINKRFKALTVDTNIDLYTLANLLDYKFKDSSFKERCLLKNSNDTFARGITIDPKRLIKHTKGCIDYLESLKKPKK